MGKPNRETDRAQQAYTKYEAMPKPRSLRRLAEQEVETQQAEYAVWEEGQRRAQAIVESGVGGEYGAAARAKLTEKPPKVQSVEVVERCLKTWSSTHGWQQRVREYDLEEAQNENRRRTAAVRTLNDQHANIAGTLVARATKRALDMLASDEEEYAAWQTNVARARKLIQQLEAKGDLGNLQKAVAMSADLEKRPKPYFGAYSLVQLLDKGLETHRVAVESATLVADEQAEAALPPVVEVSLTGTPPPEPIDPNELAPDGLGGDGGAGEGMGASEAPVPGMPLVMLTTSAPPSEDDLETRFGPGTSLDDLMP